MFGFNLILIDQILKNKIKIKRIVEDIDFEVLKIHIRYFQIF